LTEVQAAFEVIPVDEPVARTFAEIVAEARRAGRMPGIIDALIAATAIVEGVPVYTRDAGFDHIPGLDVVRA
jgi:predicted nucleic acid-binding protein